MYGLLSWHLKWRLSFLTACFSSGGACCARYQVDESDYRATLARTLHSLTALSGEVGGLRGDLRLDVDRLSSRLLAKVRLIWSYRKVSTLIAFWPRSD